MKDLDNSKRDSADATVSNTGSEVKPLQKRGRGRPRGAKNKISASSREVLEKYGPDVMEATCKFALGKSISRINAKGQREKVTPNVSEIQFSQRLVIDRLVPALKATELTGADGEPLVPGAAETPSNRDLARVVFGILGDAKLVEANIEEAPHFDPQHPRAVIGMARLEDASPSVASCTDTGAPDTSPDSNDCEPGGHILVGDKGAQVILDAETNKWVVFDAHGTLHGYRRSRADAEEFAATLPGLKKESDDERV